MDGKDLKTKFEGYLQQKGEDPKKLEQTTKRFGNSVFDMFLNGLESYRKDLDRSYKQVFLEIVIPQMKKKLNMFGDYYFKDETYKKYESLFVNFMMFAREDREYINNLIFDKRKEKLENIVEGKYGKVFDKKEFLKTWHNYIKEDTGKNGDKLRGCLTDIYGYLNVEGLSSLYEIFFNSYEICSKVTSKNKEHKGKENYKERDAFGEAFSNLESKLPGFNGEKLGEVKSLFGKYLNFVPKYREYIFAAMNEKTDGGKIVQKDTKTSLVNDLSGDQGTTEKDYGENPKESDNTDGIEEQRQRNQDDFGDEGDGFGPIKVINSSRDNKRGIFDQTERGDIIAPIDYGIFPDTDTTREQ